MRFSRRAADAQRSSTASTPEHRAIASLPIGRARPATSAGWRARRPPVGPLRQLPRPPPHRRHAHKSVTQHSLVIAGTRGSERFAARRPRARARRRCQKPPRDTSRDTSPGAEAPQTARARCQPAPHTCSPATRACWHRRHAIQPNARPEARYYGKRCRQAASRTRLALGADTRSRQRHVARHVTAPRPAILPFTAQRLASEPAVEAEASAIEPIADRAAPLLGWGNSAAIPSPHPCITAALPAPPP